MSWGYHLILDCYDCDPASIRSKENIEAFAKTMVKEIDMVAYGEPQVIHFGSDDKAGYTLVQLIETSNISAHFSEDTNVAYIDIFSCKPYDIVTAMEVVDQFFAPKNIDHRYIERG